MQTQIIRKKKGFRFAEAPRPDIPTRPRSSKQILAAIKVDGRTPELMSALMKAQAREAGGQLSRRQRRRMARKRR